MTRIQLPDFVTPDLVDDVPEVDEQGRRWIDVDDDITPAVLALWAAGIPTRYSCSGHGGDTGVVLTAVPGGDPDQWLCVMTREQMDALAGAPADIAHLLAEVERLTGEHAEIQREMVVYRLDENVGESHPPRLRDPEYFYVGGERFERTATCCCCDGRWAWGWVGDDGICLHCVDGRASLRAELAATRAACAEMRELLEPLNVTPVSWDHSQLVRVYASREHVARVVAVLATTLRRTGQRRGQRRLPPARRGNSNGR